MDDVEERDVLNGKKSTKKIHNTTWSPAILMMNMIDLSQVSEGLQFSQYSLWILHHHHEERWSSRLTRGKIRFRDSLSLPNQNTHKKSTANRKFQSQVFSFPVLLFIHFSWTRMSSSVAVHDERQISVDSEFTSGIMMMILVMLFHYHESVSQKLYEKLTTTLWCLLKSVKDEEKDDKPWKRRGDSLYFHFNNNSAREIPTSG